MHWTILWLDLQDKTVRASILETWETTVLKRVMYGLNDGGGGNQRSWSL
jgi:hypothetical protein